MELAELAQEVRNKTIGMAATDHEKAAFESFCEAKNLKPSQMLRLMLSKVCPGDIEPGEARLKALRSDSMHLRLTSQEAKDIRARAKDEATTGPGWVRKIIRAVLYKRHAFNPTEVNALRESNRELAHLGRNINQIAHELHISMNASDQINAQRLLTLANVISTHRQKVADLINSNWGRMGGEE